MTYPIDSGIPPPKAERRAGVNYAALPLLALDPGQSILIEPHEYGELSVHSVAANVRQRAIRMGIRVRTQVRNMKRDGEVGLRCWKI